MIIFIWEYSYIRILIYNFDLKMVDKIRLSHVSLAVLGLIAEGKSYPYELMKKIEERQMKNWTNIGQSSLYGVINKLEEEGLITSKIITSEQNRTQKMLSITDKGFKVLKEKIIAILSYYPRRTRDWSLAFSNIKILTSEEKIKVFETCIDVLNENKQQLLERLEFGKSVFPEKPPLHFRGLFTHALKMIDASIEFCEEVLKELREEEEKN